MRDYVFIGIIAYLCGSIPFGYLLVRLFKGKDIRKSGSGNIGATNVARTAPGLGIATLFLDAGKGIFAVYLVQVLAVSTLYFPSLFDMQGWAALWAVLGHMFPVWLGFRGGKGVATAVGCLGFLSPLSVLIAFGVFAVVLGTLRYVSLGSIVGAIAFPIVIFFVDVVHGRHYPLGLLLSVIAISMMIILKHQANIRRLLNGTENRFGKKRSKEQIVTED